VVYPCTDDKIIYLDNRATTGHLFFEMGCFTPASSSDDAHSRFVAKFHSLEYYISRIAKDVYKDQPVENRKMKHHTYCILLER
jgi:hypothetical protein